MARPARKRSEQPKSEASSYFLVSIAQVNIE
jgi:hypothetical protein